MMSPSSAALRRALPWLAFGAMACVAARPQTAAETDSRRILLVAAWAPCTPETGGAHLEAHVRATIQRMHGALRHAARGVRIDPPLFNPGAKELLDAVHASSQPLWLFYAGHGTRKPGASAICLPDGLLAIRSLIDAIPERSPASLWFDACESAAVDVPRANVSVFSASPRPVDSTNTVTPIGDALVRALQTGDPKSAPDFNRDMIVTDRELHAAVALRLRVVGQNPARPKLRNASRALPLFTLPATGALSTPPNDYRTVEWDESDHTPLEEPRGSHDGTRVRHRLAPNAVQQQALRRGGFEACGCSEPIGHCYCRSHAAAEGEP